MDRSSYLLFYALFLSQVISVFTQYSTYADYGNIETTNINTSVLMDRYDYAKANFGYRLPVEPEDYFQGILHKPFTNNECTQISKPPDNAGVKWIALIMRSDPKNTVTCSFIDKVYKAQLVGYSAVIIYNYDGDRGGLVPMYSDNDTLTAMVTIPSVFVSYIAGLSMCDQSYSHSTDMMTMAEFQPFGPGLLNPYKILIPMAFSFIGILIVAIIVMIVRWCHAFRKRRRSRISKAQLRKLPLVVYKDGDQYDCCAICLDDYEAGEKVRQLPCAHTYHKKCIDPWLLKNKRTCPVCKRRVVPKKPRRSRHTDSSESDDVEEGRTGERHPLLGPPASREPASSESEDEARGYGATGELHSNLARISEESGQHSPSSPERRRSRPRQRPSHFADDEDSDEGDDLRNPRAFLVQASQSSHMADSHSLQSISNDFTNEPRIIPPLPDVDEAQRMADLRRAIDIEDSADRFDVNVEPSNDDEALLLGNDSNQNVII